MFFLSILHETHTLFLMLESSQRKFCVVFLKQGHTVSFECSDTTICVSLKRCS